MTWYISALRIKKCDENAKSLNKSGQRRIIRVKELIDVEWGQAVIDNLSSNEVYDILGDICTS